MEREDDQRTCSPSYIFFSSRDLQATFPQAMQTPARINTKVKSSSVLLHEDDCIAFSFRVWPGPAPCCRNDFDQEMVAYHDDVRGKERCYRQDLGTK